MLIVIKTNNEIVELVPKGSKVLLEELQAAVGGFIEMINVYNKVMIVNEEGKLEGLPINKKATEFFQMCYRTNDVIVGNAILADRDELG